MATVVRSRADISSLESSSALRQCQCFIVTINYLRRAVCVRGRAYQRHFVATQLIEKPVIILERESREAHAEEFCLS